MKIKTIGLVAHDNRKKDLLEWIDFNREKLETHRLVCTGTTGRMIKGFFDHHVGSGKKNEVNIKLLKSGPLGGDQQLGAMIAEEKIDLLIFLWDPMQPQPHDVDVKALLRIAVLYNIPVANNRSTADFIISSPLFDSDYIPTRKDYSKYIHREL
ncbi:MAG: methylglyoxal synthase [Chlorobi bacterium]|nr:methylglyoxal synthase [Chlorobiota bacterium]